MACVVWDRKKRRWRVDWRDGSGRRCKKFFRKDQKDRADLCFAEEVKRSQQGAVSAVDPNITIKDYAKIWLPLVEVKIKPATFRSYRLHVDRHIVPALGAFKVRQLDRGRIKAFLSGKASETYSRGVAEKAVIRTLSRNSVRLIHATLRSMLTAAVDDQLVLANAAEGLGRYLRLTTTAKDREKEIKAMDADQLARFVRAAESYGRRVPMYGPMFIVMGYTGLRLGEAFGLKEEDLDFDRQEVLVERTLSDGEEGTTKGGRSRLVDMSDNVRDLLRRLRVLKREEGLRREWGEISPWVFVSDEGTPLDQSHAGKAFKSILKAAKLPGHFTPHCLRHTFASLLLQQGQSPAYVQRQLGHASIQLTVDTYGRWLPMGDKAAVNRLADRIESAMSAAGLGGNPYSTPEGEVSEGSLVTKWSPNYTERTIKDSKMRRRKSSVPSQITSGAGGRD